MNQPINEQQTDVTQAPAQESALNQVLENTLQLDPRRPEERRILIEERGFSVMQRKANALANSTMVPIEYQRYPTKKSGNGVQRLPENINAIANCMIALEMAERLNTGVLEIMQNLHVVYGRPGFSSLYLIARVNASNVIKGRLKYEMRVPDQPQDITYTVTEWQGGRSSQVQKQCRLINKQCRAVGICADTGERLEGSWVSMEMAVQEGWYHKSGSKWQTMPDQMLMYRSAAFWSRVHAPDATLGLHTVEENTDIVDQDFVAEFEQPAATGTDFLAAARNNSQPTSNQEPVSQKEPEISEESIVHTSTVSDEFKWPLLMQDEQGNQYWVDFNKQVYDPEEHGWSKEKNQPSVTESGVFRKKRKTTKNPDNPNPNPVAEPASVTDTSQEQGAGPSSSQGQAQPQAAKPAQGQPVPGVQSTPAQDIGEGKSVAFNKLKGFIDVAQTVEQLQKVDNMDMWGQLNISEGEARELRQYSESKKSQLSQSPT